MCAAFSYCVVQRKRWNAENIPKTTSEDLQNPAQTRLNPFKSEVGDAHGCQDAPKCRPRAPKRNPETSKSVSSAPKSRQPLKIAKGRPKPPQETPRPFQNRAQGTPKLIVCPISSKSSSRKASGTIFRCFLLGARRLQSQRNIAKTVVLSRSKHFGYASAHA